jgi:YD repeat-containing protein
MSLAAVALCAMPPARAGQTGVAIGAAASGVDHSPAVDEAVAGKLAAAHFPEPLVTTGPTTQAEDRALLRAVAAYERRTNPEDFTSLNRFLSAHPHSGWRAALLTNLGLSYLHYGYFSRAIDAWEEAWRAGKDATGLRAKALVDRTVGELVRLHAQLGHVDRAASLLDEIGDRPITGSATEAVQTARDTLWVMRNDPRHLCLCGPMALRTLMLEQHAPHESVKFLDKYRTGPKGVSLAEVARLAEQAKLPYQPIFRNPGEPVPVPSVVHWRVGHFAAIVGEAGDRYFVKDPVLGPDTMLVTRAALDEQASGYFLASVEEEQKNPWRKVASKDAKEVWGAGPVLGTTVGDAVDKLANPASCNTGMCGYNIKELVVGLTLSDTPVGYTPPIGPAVKVRLTYNQREDSQPANFNFFNVSPKWSINWLSYVQDDPGTPGKTVTRYLPDGGAYYYLNYTAATGTFAPQVDDASVLSLVSKSPVTYQRTLNDGSAEIYSQSDGSTAFPRRIFLSKIVDPQGNAVTLNYDSQRRLSSITDATGRNTTFTYGRSGSPLLITQITDPFGRSAVLNYDSSGRLASITDVLGLTSGFTYDSSSLVNSMTTVYGTTRFAYGTTPSSRFLQVTDPLGNNEREEYLQPAPVPDAEPANTVPRGMTAPNGSFTVRTNFHWDKHAYTLAHCTATGGCNYTMARATHFNHDANNGNLESGNIDSIKNPLENRVWFNYPGQPTASYSGTYFQPLRIGRVLDDGTTQLTQFAYNGFGKVIQAIDPLGRATQLTYAANQIDLTAVTQKTASGAATVGQWTYNAQHRPLTYTDAAGQTSQYTYNTAGQLTPVTNPLRQTTSFQYDSLGYLATIINPDGKVAATFTRDAFDRIATYTDSEGWTVGYTYDAADRVTAITYPDGTTDQYTWDKLDLAAYQDRQGNVRTYAHDADRRLTAVTDPLGNQTQFGYYENDRLKSLTDPNGHTTNWTIDLQSRPTAKIYADGTETTYSYETTTSRLKSVTDALGQSRNYQYALDDRLAGISYLNALNPTPNVAFAYDPSFPRITAMTDGSGTTSYSYIPVGSLGALQLQQETGPLPNGAIAYLYDALGRVAARTVGGGVQESFQYDAIGRLVGHTDALGQFAIGYLGETAQPTSRGVSGIRLATGWSYQPNSADRRLAGIVNATARQYGYTTTPENLIGEISEQTATGNLLQDWKFAYDNDYRLLSGVSTALGTYGYTPDPAGNLTKLVQPSGSTSLTYNSVNEITAAGAQAFTYDANGNLVSDGARNYAWDAENRLVGISYAAQPGKKTTFAYDGLDRRVAIATTAARTTALSDYIWCGSRICQSRDGTSTVNRLY